MAYVPNSGGGKKPKDDGNGFLNFLGNLVDDAQETATGLIPGLAHIGSSVAHDIGRPLGLTRGPNRTDDILDAILHSYTDKGTFWGEIGRGASDLFSGDFSGANRHRLNARSAFVEHPLGPLLDASALFTGGIGAAVKGGKLAGIAGKTPRVSRVEFAPGKGFERTLHDNPVIAGRQALFDRASNKFVDAPVVGARARVSRQVRRTEARKSARENAANLRPLREALAKVRGLDRKAVWIAAGGHNIDDLMRFYAVRHKALDAEIQRKTREGIRKGDATLAVKGDRVKRADTDEELAYDEASFDNLRDADRGESLKVNRRNLALVKTRLGELEQIRDKVDLSSPRIQRAADAARELSELTTGRLVREGLDPQLAANRASLEAQLLRVAGVRDDVYRGAIRSHVSVTPQKMDVSSGRSQKWTAGGKLDELQRNTGYNFWNAKDSTNPAMFIHSARQVFEYRARLDRVETMLEYAQWVSPKEAAALTARGEWKSLDGVKPEIQRVHEILEGGRSVLEGTPGYQSFLQALEESFVAPSKFSGQTDLVPLVPAKFYTEVVGEFQRASKFVQKWIDTPTRVWRALTLNLRPAWIVNNFVGQMLLLATAHGVRGLRAYVEQFGKKGKIADELAPELTDFGWAHESMADLAGLGGNRVTRGMRRASDAMGNLNAKLTDDHTRKAAWVASMKPHVAKYQRAHPGTSWEDAARALWQDERFADAITERVLADMIDFSDLSNFERRVVKRAIPFYAWMKGISKRTGRLILDDPVKAAVGAQVGQAGLALNEEQYGELPHFLRGIVDIPGVDDPDKILVTQGLNPFMTPADVSAMLGGSILPGRHTGPQNPLAQANPLLKSPLEALANQDFFYGGELDREGEERSFAQRAVAQFGQSIAQKRLVDEWLQQREAETTGLEYDPLFAPSFRNALASYFGAPVRELDVDEARRRAREEQ